MQPLALVAAHTDWLFGAAWLRDDRLLTSLAAAGWCCSVNDNHAPQRLPRRHGAPYRCHPASGSPQHCCGDTRAGSHAPRARRQSARCEARAQGPQRHCGNRGIRRNVQAVGRNHGCWRWRWRWRGMWVVRPNQLAQLDVVSTVPIPGEILCVAPASSEQGEILVGGSAGVSVVDPRAGRAVALLGAAEPSTGAVRSLGLASNLLSVGDSAGRLCFVDLVARREIAPRYSSTAGWVAP
eukprot:TRINITY_DN876_c1_g1_i2.p1 TRINITY_DN876_c1_g1~~TRINITY_DN876_c1_g1_i2.p1  ORF type:complete len:249 (-),score=27.27 TRINITY_DN876_c1_g1_i2:105-818(-)